MNTAIPRKAGGTVAFLMGFLLAACSAQPTTQHNPPAPVPGGDPAQGAQVLAEYGCGSCHTIPGVTGADSAVGPPLTDWAERRFIAGALANEPENLMRWIRFPQEIEPGTAMPNMGVDEQAARDMAAYLFTLRRADRSGIWPFSTGNR